MSEQDSPIQTALPQHPEVARADSRRLRSHWAINTIAIGVILAICYYGEKALAVILISVLLAFILAPLTDALMRLRMPRAVASAIAMLLLLACIAGVVYYSYNQGTAFFRALPKYTHEIREEILKFRRKAASLEVLSPGPEQQGEVTVHTATNWTEILARGFGSVTDFFLAISFIPFLTYFMLTWHHHVRSATVMLFPLQDRHSAFITLGLISDMVRGFLVGNVLMGLFMGVVSTAVFGFLHLPFFYFIGFISGFVSLIPYLGVLLALVPPLLVGVGDFHSGEFIVILVTVFTLHLLALNVLYPKFLGNRLQLNPLAVTLSLLIWAWLWGAIGLLLAIPITAAMKIIFDHVESLKPYGAWLGE